MSTREYSSIRGSSCGLYGLFIGFSMVDTPLTNCCHYDDNRCKLVKRFAMVEYFKNGVAVLKLYLIFVISLVGCSVLLTDGKYFNC